MKKVGVIGLGYVGLPLLVELGNAGFEAHGMDVDERKVASIRKGKSYIGDVPDKEVARLVKAGKVHATTDFDVLSKLDAVSICVPTPLRKTRDPDISYIVSAVEEVVPRIHKGMLVILESTTYPGTTDELVLPELERSGLKVGKDFFLAFSPERVDPGNAVYQTRNTPKIVGGVTAACTKVAVDFYGKVFDSVVPVSSARCAEMVKLLENTFRSVNIGLVNEMAIMCERLGLNVYEVIDAAATKPFGFMPFYPGPGLGGHCIPIDPHYLSWKLKTLNYYAKFIELAAEINGNMPSYVISKVVSALNDQGKSVRSSKVVVLGAAYKKDVSDVRESPALDILHQLIEKGAVVCYSDPHIPEVSEGTIRLRSVPLTKKLLNESDCVVIVTNHTSFDYRMILRESNLVVDTRNATKGLARTGKVVTL
ncbi:MAG: nucleotide sugar dehydrogenase [bacterium]